MTHTARAIHPRPQRGLYLILPALLSVSTMAAGPPLRIEARLLTPISSYSSRVGSEIRALVTTPLCIDGGAIPEGAVLRGSLLKKRRVGLGLVRETASLQTEFHDLRLSDGSVYAVEAHLESIDNARERIDAKGVIHGIRATSALSNRAGERLIFLAMGHPYAVVPLLALEAGLFHFPDPEIQYRRGTELYLNVKLPEEWGPAEACPSEPVEASEQEMTALRGLVDDLPYWSYSKRQSQPMDLVNLLFVGSSAALETAFDAAGWTGSRSNSFSAGFGAIRALAERNADEDAPMRTLLLSGAEPAYALQKSLNTFEKRHHLRIWQREGEWRGQPVWASAATKDIGTTFSMRPFGFTHEIQNQVDLERDKVVSDLQFTGCVATVIFVPRPEPVRGSGQDYRRGVSTDAKVAVVIFNSCQQPRLDLAAGPLDPQPSRLVRGFRRVTLVTRNHFIRDNWFWRGYEALRMSYAAIRGWEMQAKDERRAREHDMRLLAQQRSAAEPLAK
jgi:LssY-like putative type I secretion system component LssY